ncbi:unnamed protein product [Diamesa hyperborea]
MKPKTIITSELNKIYESSYTWKIDKFIEKSEVLKSDVFNIDGTNCSWYLLLNPRYCYDNYYGYDSVKLNFFLVDKSDDTTSYKFEIKRSKIVWKVDDFANFKGSVESENTSFIHRNSMEEFLINDALFLDIKVIVRTTQKVTEYIEGPQKLSEDMLNMLNSMEYSDFTFIVERKRFPVHKIILAARSPVFKAMFSTNMEEARSNETVITDVSSESFGEFLNYLYSGKCPNLEVYAMDLLVIADKYEIDDLKKLCEVKILLNLTQENAPAVFELANIYRCANELKTEAFELIKKSFLDNNYIINDNLLEHPEKLRELLEIKRNLEFKLNLYSLPKIL